MTRLNGEIVYYSHTGHTRRAAEQLARRVDGDLFEWTCDRYRTPGFGFLRAGYDALRGARPAATVPLPELSSRDWLVLAGPVWAGRPSAPLGSMIEATRDFAGLGAILLTSGDAKIPSNTFAACDDIRGTPFPIRLHLPNSIEDTPEFDQRLSRLAEALSSAQPDAAE